MQNLTQAQQQKQQQNAVIIAQLLKNVSTTFAQINYATQVATAAAHKHVNITKVTNANVQLFSNINADTSVYTNAVKRSAANISSNDAQNVQNFAAQQNYYEHTNCYSIVQHKQSALLYLYCIYNNAKSVYYINNTVASKQQVAQYLTASAAAKLLQKDNAVHNVTHNVTHNVIIRTIALHNINSINAMQQQVTL